VTNYLDVVEKLVDEMTADSPNVRAKVLLFKSISQALEANEFTRGRFDYGTLSAAVVGVDVSLPDTIPDDVVEQFVRVTTKVVVKGVEFYLQGIGDPLFQIDLVLTAMIKTVKLTIRD
jgi:radical SAM superfamily enzyme